MDDINSGFDSLVRRRVAMTAVASETSERQYNYPSEHERVRRNYVYGLTGRTPHVFEVDVAVTSQKRSTTVIGVERSPMSYLALRIEHAARAKYTYTEALNQGMKLARKPCDKLVNITYWLGDGSE